MPASPSSGTGLVHGSGGCGRIASVETLPPDAVQAAREGRPAAADRALRAWCEQSLKLRLRLRLDSEARPLETTIRGEPDVGTTTQALEAVRRMCQPAPPEFIAKEIAKTWAVTAARPQDEADVRTAVMVFQESLSTFPPDVIAAAFRDWRNTEKWRPTLAEIRQRCWSEYRGRVGLKDALEVWLRERQ